jgi:hypothetical protein
MNRSLTDDERDLIRWMLEHGEPGAKEFLPQLEKAQVAPWKCTCGCASIKLLIPGSPEATGGIHPIADFVFDANEDLSGIFVFEQNGILSGVEVYGMAGDAPKSLPSPNALRDFSNAM